MVSRSKYIVFGILTLLTLFFTLIIGRFQTIGPELLLNGQFNDGLANWNQSASKNTSVNLLGTEIILQSPDTFATVTLSQDISDPGRFDFLRLSGEIKAERVIHKETHGDNARLSLIFLDKDGEKLPQETRVKALLGSHPWKYYSRVFSVPPQAEKALVSGQLLNATGTMWIRNLSLQEVYEKPIYPYGKVITILLWSLFLLWLIVPLIVEARRSAVQVVISLAIASIMLGTLMSETVVNSVKGKSTESIKEISANNRADSDPVKNKLKKERGHFAMYLRMYLEEGSHFILFAFLGFGLMLGYSLEKFKHVLISIAMLAAVTELLQFFVEGRSPSWLDLVIDIIGALFGIYLAHLIQSKQSSRIIVN